MGRYIGEMVRGILHSSDASGGVEIPMYIFGSETVRVLAANEYLAIDEIELVSAAGGDCYVIIGPDASVGTGETVIRGTFATNGGVSTQHLDRAGDAGQKAFLTAPIGVVDVVFTGRIMKAATQGLRPNWRQSLIPGV